MHKSQLVLSEAKARVRRATRAGRSEVDVLVSGPRSLALRARAPQTKNKNRGKTAAAAAATAAAAGAAACLLACPCWLAGFFQKNTT